MRYPEEEQIKDGLLLHPSEEKPLCNVCNVSLCKLEFPGRWPGDLVRSAGHAGSFVA